MKTELKTGKNIESTMTYDWKQVKLKEICNIKKGQSITSKDITFGEIPVITGGQTPAYYHNVANYKDKTITVSGSGMNAGFVNYFEMPIFVLDCSAITSKHNKILLKYVYYILKAQQKIIYNFQKCMAQPHVYPKDLMNLEINLPPLNIQQKIVSILEKTEKLKQIRKEADELTTTFLNMTFLEMFDKFPNTEILGDHLLFLTSGSRGWAKYYSDKGDIFLRIQNIGKNSLNMKNILFVIPPNTTEAKRTEVKSDDVLLSITADLGRTCVIPQKFPKAFVNQHLAILRLDQYLNPMFVAHYLSTKGMTQINKLNKGVTKSGLNFQDIRSIKIPSPPLKLQQSFADIVLHIEQLKKYQNHSKEHIHNLFSTMMQKSQKGELTC